MKTYLCIDYSNCLHRFAHGLPEMRVRKTGKVTHPIYGWIHLLKKINQRLPFIPADTEVIVFFDSKREVPADGESALGFEYKGNRKQVDPDLAWNLKMGRKITALMGFQYCEMEGREADHLIGSFVLSKRSDNRVFILSSDKDMLQLVGGTVWGVKAGGNGDYTLMDTAAVRAKWGVEPSQIADLLTLMGDTSDNIPGVPGIGVKTAQKLLQEHGNLDRILEHIPSMKGKMKENFEKTLPQIPAIRALTEFHDVPGLEVVMPEKDIKLLREVLRQLEMYKTISLFDGQS